MFAALDQNGHAENGDAESRNIQPDPSADEPQVDAAADETADFGKKKKKGSKQKGIHFSSHPAKKLAADAAGVVLSACLP